MTPHERLKERMNREKRLSKMCMKCDTKEECSQEIEKSVGKTLTGIAAAVTVGTAGLTYTALNTGIRTSAAAGLCGFVASVFALTPVSVVNFFINKKKLRHQKACEIENVVGISLYNSDKQVGDSRNEKLMHQIECNKAASDRRPANEKNLEI